MHRKDLRRELLSRGSRARGLRGSPMVRVGALATSALLTVEQEEPGWLSRLRKVLALGDGFSC